MRSNRRKRYIVESNFQKRFISRFVLIVSGLILLSVALVLGVFYFKYQYHGADLRNLIIMVTPDGTTDVSSLFQIVLTPILIAGLVFLVIIIPYSLFYSHKIAGPIYRFRKAIDFLINGKMDFMINLRKKDEFEDIANKMNELIDYMRRNVDEARLSYRVVSDKVTVIEKLIKEDGIDFGKLKGTVSELDRFFKERKRPFSY